MDVTSHQHAEREAWRVQAYREELVERIARAIPEDGIAEPLAGFHLGRLSSPPEEIQGVLGPSFCVIAQGSKEVLLGDSRYRYDPLHYLLATVELPSIRRVLEASKERPYLSLRLELDSALVGAVMVESGHASPPGRADERAIDVSTLDVSLLDARAGYFAHPHKKHPKHCWRRSQLRSSFCFFLKRDWSFCFRVTQGQARRTNPAHKVLSRGVKIRRLSPPINRQS